MTYVGKDYEPTLQWAYYLGIAVVVALVIFMRPKPNPAPKNAVVYGCYKTASGPPILLNALGLQVEQRGFPRIGYHLERLKTGIALTTEAPIDASVERATYRFFMDRRGTGIYLNFFRDIDGRRYGVFDDIDLTRFAMITQDSELLYRRVGSNC